MAERYTILQHNTNTFHVVDCPILLVSHALTKDNQNNNIFIQCKFENTLSKPIKALYVHINCFDVTNNPLPDVDSFSYLDIEVKQYQTFGDRTPIVLPDKETRNVSIIPTKIVFVDGSTWENKSFKPFELFHIDNTPISELGELAEEYRRELHGICLQSDKHKYLPAHKDGYTICGCGKILVDAERTCPACGVDLEKLFALHDVDKLQEALEQYKQEQAEREEQARQAEEERQKQIEAQKQKAIKIGKKAGIIGGSIVALIAVCALVVQVIIPNVRYSMANNAVSAGNYEEAISTFEDLTDFKDSQEKIKEAQYAWAESKLANGDAEGAIELFEQLGDYKDSVDNLRTLLLPKTKEIVERVTSVSGQNGVKISGTVEGDTIQFELSGLGMNLKDIPRRLDDFSITELSELYKDTSTLLDAIDSWVELKDTCVEGQQIIVSKFVELGGDNGLFPIHTVYISDDNIKMFEFQDTELTFDYWASMEKYNGDRLELFSDLLSCLADYGATLHYN